MHIRFIHPSPKAGQEEHVENTAGRTLILAGFAEEVPAKGYQERLAALERERQRTSPAPVAQWSVQESMSSNGKILVIKTYLGEVTYFDAPPNDCPPVVVKRWNEKVSLERSLAADQPKIEAAKRAHAAQESRERDARRY